MNLRGTQLNPYHLLIQAFPLPLNITDSVRNHASFVFYFVICLFFGQFYFVQDNNNCKNQALSFCSKSLEVCKGDT